MVYAMVVVVVALSWDQLHQPNINSIPLRLPATQAQIHEWIYGAVNRVFRLYELDKRHAKYYLQTLLPFLHLLIQEQFSRMGS